MVTRFFGITLVALSLTISVFVQAQQTIRVGVFDNKPIVFKDDHGKISGFAVDLLEKIAQQNHWQIEYRFDAWSNQLPALENGDIDLLVGIAYSRQRAEKFDFTNQTAINNWGVVLQGENTNITSLQDLVGKRVALMTKSIHSTAFIDTMKGFNFPFTIVDAKDYYGALDAVSQGKANAAVVNRVFSLLHGQKANLRETGIIFNPVEVRFAAPKGRSADILASIDKSLSKAKNDSSSFYYLALNKWLGNISTNANYKWVFWVVIVVVTLLGLALVYNFLLAKQVKSRTRQLARSERRYKMAQNAAQIGSWEWDIKNNNVYWSDNIPAMFGLQSKHFDGKYDSYLALLEPEDRHAVAEAIDNALKNEQGYLVEHKILWPDGSEHWLIGKGEIQRDRDGAATRIIGVFQDITYKSRAEDALRQSEEKYRNLINNVQEGIWVIDENNITSFTNPAMERILGYEPGEMVGKSLFDFMDDQGKQIAARNVERRKQGITEQHDFEFIRKDGKRIFTAMVTSPVLEGDVYKGAIAGVIDITARIEAENTLKESEERFRQLAENINAVFWIGSSDWTRVLYVSPAFEKIWGRSCDSLYANPLSWLDYVHPDDRSQVEKDIKAKIAGRLKDPVFREYRIIRPDQSLRWVSARAYPIMNHEGEVYRVAGIAEDVTERREAELALARSKAEFEAIFNSITDASIYADENRSIVMVNPAVSKVFGYTSEEVIGHKTEILYANKADFVAQGKRQFNKDTPIKNATYEMRYRRKDGSVFIGDTLGTKVYDAQGNILGLLAIIRDVSQRHEAEAELEKHRHRLEELVKERTQEYENINKELEAFSYSVSHDLRAPLRAIDGFSEALREDYDDLLDATGKEYINRVRNAAQRMSLLIDDLLHLSRVSRAEVEKYEVDLSQVVNVSIKRHLDTHPDAKIKYIVQPDLMVQADKRLLEIMVNNLIDNAIKYTKNVKQPVIEFGCQQKNGERAFFIKDNGAGFDMRFANKLFTPFQRLHNPTEFEGTGIGLATVKRIVSLHGGQVWADAEEGQGATFYFTLGPSTLGS